MNPNTTPEMTPKKPILMELFHENQKISESYQKTN